MSYDLDIRDTVKYKEIMKQYGLGPNGAIVTSLNLFSTRFDQVMKIIDKRRSEYDYVIFDTPGQIEVFAWSAAGTLITDTLASGYPTVVVYVMDMSRSQNPITFMSNMLYACSILYKTKLPFIIAFNKIDVTDHSFAEKWMKDFESFEAAADSDTSYMANLTRSLSLVLDKFYQNIRTVGVSSMTGAGIPELFTKLKDCYTEYYTDYKPEYERIKREAQKAAADEATKKLEKLTTRDKTDHKTPGPSGSSLITSGDAEPMYDSDQEDQVTKGSTLRGSKGDKDDDEGEF